jgi:bifunctional DNA-binding transcriptional regulator/antitoxin component of YhaV-PrlF toxin-antitoxin module
LLQVKKYDKVVPEVNQMIIKRSTRNQVAIPKKLIQQAGLGEQDVFFDIRYAGGYFVLKPLEFEEKIPRETLERFKAKTLKAEPGDKTFASMDELIEGLGRKKRR